MTSRFVPRASAEQFIFHLAVQHAVASALLDAQTDGSKAVSNG